MGLGAIFHIKESVDFLWGRGFFFFFVFFRGWGVKLTVPPFCSGGDKSRSFFRFLMLK